MSQPPFQPGAFEGRLPVVAALCALAVSLAAASDALPPQGLRLIDLEGGAADPIVGSAPATVFVFARTDCPISNRYAPEVRRLHERFASRGVRFWLVYPDPEEPLAAIRDHLTDYGYPMKALRDPQHDLVRATGVEVTPEAVVFAPDGQLVYRGRIDDRYVDFGKARPTASRHDLERAIEAVLAGSQPEERTTRAVGCFIPPLE
jgi:hypothetical protein